MWRRDSRQSADRGKRTGAPRRRTLMGAAALGAILSSAMAADTLAQPESTALEAKAADYIRFRDDVAAIEGTPFTSAETTREAHRRFSSHQSEGLSGGWVAYAALVAADTPEFAEALEKEMKKKGPNGLKGRDGLLARLAGDPGYARGIKGADVASARVLAMTAQDAHRIVKLGEAFKSEAYAMQKTKWGAQRIAASSSRLSEAETYARSRGRAATPDLAAETDNGVTSPMLASTDASWAPDWGAQGAASGNSEKNAEVIMDRVLNLAARYSMSAVNDKIVEVYAKNDRADQCLSMAMLTLKQCIAATRTPYEEAFCVGEHGLNDVASCVGWVAGAGAS